MITQLTAFGRISIDNLSATAQALYLRLILIDNGLGWPERFYASNSRLMTEAGINSEKTLITARNQLIQMGLVEYRKGTAKGKASTYKLKIIPTTGVTTVGTTVGTTVASAGVTTVGTTVASAGVSGAYMTDQYRQEKTRQEKTIAATATRAREGDSALAEVVRVFEENIHPLSGTIERDNLIDLVDEYGGLWVTSAIGEAALGNGRSLRYITAILERWKRDGFKAPRKGVKQHGAGRNDSREALEERYSDFAEADRNYIPPWKLRPPGGGDQAASGGDCGH
nr:MAG TPA: DnaD [Caudoviricetes sp.]